MDPAKFVCNALAPAEISRVIIDEGNNLMEVIVPDEFLSIAIGKKGQNVRLASKLTNWHLDVKSETRYNEAMQTGYDSLVALPGVGISLADALYESGFYSAEEIREASVEDLVQIRGIGDEKAAKLLEAAQNAALEAAEAQQAAENERGDADNEAEAVDADGTPQPSEPSDEHEPEPSEEGESEEKND
jgi:N utilization substance protein A